MSTTRSKRAPRTRRVAQRRPVREPAPLTLVAVLKRARVCGIWMEWAHGLADSGLVRFDHAFMKMQLGELVDPYGNRQTPTRWQEQLDLYVLGVFDNYKHTAMTRELSRSTRVEPIERWLRDHMTRKPRRRPARRAAARRSR